MARDSFGLGIEPVNLQRKPLTDLKWKFLQWFIGLN